MHRPFTVALTLVALAGASACDPIEPRALNPVPLYNAAQADPPAGGGACHVEHTSKEACEADDACAWIERGDGGSCGPRT